MAVQDRAAKVEVLRAKIELKKLPGYQNVWVQSSKSHVERLQEINTRKLLNVIQGGDKLKIASNGRLIDRKVINAEPTMKPPYKRKRIVSDEGTQTTMPTTTPDRPTRRASADMQIDPIAETVPNVVHDPDPPLDGGPAAEDVSDVLENARNVLELTLL